MFGLFELVVLRHFSPGVLWPRSLMLRPHLPRRVVSDKLFQRLIWQAVRRTDAVTLWQLGFFNNFQLWPLVALFSDLCENSLQGVLEKPLTNLKSSMMPSFAHFQGDDAYEQKCACRVCLHAGIHACTQPLLFVGVAGNSHWGSPSQLKVSGRRAVDGWRVFLSCVQFYSRM